MIKWKLSNHLDKNKRRSWKKISRETQNIHCDNNAFFRLLSTHSEKKEKRVEFCYIFLINRHLYSFISYVDESGFKLWKKKRTKGRKCTIGTNILYRFSHVARERKIYNYCIDYAFENRFIAFYFMIGVELISE